MFFGDIYNAIGASVVKLEGLVWMGMAHLVKYVTDHDPSLEFKKAVPSSDFVADYRTILMMDQRI